MVDGGTASRPADPTQTGFVFIGWFTDANGNNQYNFNTPVTGDITLYAKWSQTTHTVTFNSMGGSIVQPQQVVPGDTATRPADPTQTGFYFIGWFINANDNKQYDFSSPVTDNIILYAQWSNSFDSIAAFAVWLSAQEVNTPATAYTVKLNVDDLGGSATTPGSAGSVISTNNKSVNLDLSGSTFTSIGGEAFQGCTSLTSVTIPSSVTSIGSAVFNGCASLASVTIPGSVKSIDSYAFSNCTGLASITIPNSVTSIGEEAFFLSWITSVTIGNSVTSIGKSAFYTCGGLTSVTIPDIRKIARFT